jgi:hypothetical protein
MSITPDYSGPIDTRTEGHPTIPLGTTFHRQTPSIMARTLNALAQMRATPFQVPHGIIRDISEEELAGEFDFGPPTLARVSNQQHSTSKTEYLDASMLGKCCIRCGSTDQPFENKYCDNCGREF